jgi:eukaryotic translation initiation factor 2C
MQNIKVNTGGAMRNWTSLLISMGGVPDALDRNSMHSTVAAFQKCMQGMGITAAAPIPGSRISVSGADDPQIEATLKALASPPKQARFVLIILPAASKPLYNRIKHAGDVKVGIHTICVVGTKFAKSQAQYFANVALKFNLKLGGINQLIDSARLGIISEDKTMVIGLDVTHPSPGSLSTAPSIAGMVASIDPWLAQWPADLRIQARRQEMISDLDTMMQSRLKLWKTLGKHAAYPENLLIYRDGVSEGQYDSVLELELPLIRKACAALYPAPDTKRGLPHITILIVGKRHHTRFYPTSTATADRSANPQNGTIVDRGVTEPRNWDFFLQAHTALQGTARPAHYYIVLDEIFTKRKVPPQFVNAADVLEDLTHSMCYLFGRATKAVSICPPAYYADVVCERARCYLSGLFEGWGSEQSVISGGGTDLDARAEEVLVHLSLRNTMYYI